MSQIELFDYSTLAPDLQVEVKTATERIKLRMKRTAEDIIEIGKDLIAIKEKLPHGRFLPWIASEFEMTLMTANRFMNVAERFGKSNIMLDFSPTTLYELAAPSTPDEVVEQVIEKAENGETVTAKDVKALKAKVAQLEAEKSNLEFEKNNLNQDLQEQRVLVNLNRQKAEEQAQLVAQANAKLQSEAERIAQQKAEKIKAEFESKLADLESAKVKADEDKSKAKSDYEKALEKFKSNPDPETKKAILELEDKFQRTKAEVDRVQMALSDLKKKEDQAFSASLALQRFHGAFEKLIASHPDAILAMSSPYLDDRQLAVVENLAKTLEDWSLKIRQSLEVQCGQIAKPVEVEVVEMEDF